MNRFQKFLTVGLATAACAFSLSAQNTITPINFSGPLGTPTAFGGAGVTNAAQGQNSNMIWFATSGGPLSLGVPRFLRARVGGDTTADLRLYSSTNSAAVTNAGIAGTNQLWVGSGTNGFASNDLALIQFTATDTYQLVVITNVTTAGALGISAGAKYATTNGNSADRIWKLTAIGTETTGVATNTLANSGQPFWIGRSGAPNVMVLTYSNTATMNLVTGDYWRQPRP